MRRKNMRLYVTLFALFHLIWIVIVLIASNVG